MKKHENPMEKFHEMLRPQELSRSLWSRFAAAVRPADSQRPRACCGAASALDELLMIIGWIMEMNGD